MSLSSISFVFGALPLFLILYFCLQPKYRMYSLLIFSGWFYYVNDPARLIFLVALIIANYVLSLIISRSNTLLSKICLLVGILGNVGVLFLYKYLTFSINISNQLFNTHFQTKERTLMVGLSFFVFGLISYLIDVYRKTTNISFNIAKFATYVLMFPKIIMGPIIRYRDIEGDLDNPQIKAEDIGTGAKRFMEGFFKKIIIADNLALLVSEINSIESVSQATVVTLWIGSIAYSLQLFFDFSGYSDMAIGIARMLGLHFKENFNYPYICKNFTDFWRRWHISLSEWFRDYIYIPLGGSRKSFVRNLFNLFVVWLLTGIWHGAGYNFIAWGLIYFVMLIIERYIIKPKELRKASSILWRITTLLIVNFNWVLFSHPSIKTGISYCLGMLGIYYKNPITAPSDIRLLREYGLYILLGIIFSMPIAQKIKKSTSNNETIKNFTVICMPVIYLIIFIWALSFAILGYHSPFMYQQF